MTFTRRWDDTEAQNIGYKAFQIYNDELCFFDLGVLGNNARMMRTSDGINWTQLYSALGATYGVFDENSGCALALYDDSLFVTLYRADAVNPKVLEWNGTALVPHLPNPQGGGTNNYMATALVPWARRLWCLTDVTAGALGQRSVYYYDGTNWTDITDYDTANFLDYNIAAARFPNYRIRHRTSRLFLYHGELYLLASRSPDTNMWGWEVWKFDAEAMDNFTLLFDSSTFSDDFALSAVLVFENEVRLLGNMLLQNGNPTDIAKLYRSEDMITWTEVTDFALFEDEFDDAARDARWADEANSGSITELGGVLTLAVLAATNGNWWQPNIRNAPIVTVEPNKDEITVITRLNTYTVNNLTNAGLIIGNTLTIPDGAGGYCYTLSRTKAGAQDGLEVIDVGNGGGAVLNGAAYQTLPVWLRIRISGNGAGSVIAFEYSHDGIVWTLIHTVNDFTWTFVGLHAKNWGAPGAELAISAPFEFFHVYESMGFPFGEADFDGKFYLNCQNTLRDVTWIRHWNGRLQTFSIDQEIATRPDANDRGGGLSEYLNSLFVGKWREIYAEPGALRKQLRRKRRSLWLLRLIWKNKKDEEIEELLAPIDTRADTRFWEGRIKNLSSFTRAVDDRTGLFKITDLSLTLANNDKRYSKRLARYMLKNQLAQLYHCWADEPEAWRRHIITLIVDDHSLSGTHFDLKLKDVTQRYFVAKIPESICTVEDYPNIHEDHVGRYMPEVLGNVSMTTGEKRGAVEAVYVRHGAAGTRDYLAARGWLRSAIDNANFQVYEDNVARAATMTAHTDGHSYINFTPTDPVNNPNPTVTFDCHGYPYGIWNDPTNNMVQNPAYIVAYFLRVLMRMPASMVNMLSFDAMANYFIAIADYQSGRLILQKPSDTMELFRQLLFSFGLKGFVALDGRIAIDRKDINNWAITSLDSHVFTQTELLAPGVREYNLINAINTIKARYNYIPWARLFLGADDGYVDNYYPGGPMEDKIELPREDLPI